MDGRRGEVGAVLICVVLRALYELEVSCLHTPNAQSGCKETFYVGAQTEGEGNVRGEEGGGDGKSMLYAFSLMVKLNRVPPPLAQSPHISLFGELITP